MASRKRVFGLVLAVCATATIVGQAAWAVQTQRNARVIRVIDGDTFEIAGGAKVRVRNFDTPELRSYECPAERDKAKAARDHARTLLQGARVRLSVDGRDRYNRLVADVMLHAPAGERDFVTEMMAGGHGAVWVYGEEPQPVWCDPIETAEAEAAVDTDSRNAADTLIENLEKIEKTARKVGRIAREIERIAGWFGW